MIKDGHRAYTLNIRKDLHAIIKEIDYNNKDVDGMQELVNNILIDYFKKDKNKKESLKFIFNPETKALLEEI